MATAEKATQRSVRNLWLGTQETFLDWCFNPAERRLPAHLAAGIRGERAALFELRRRGLVIVARRWTTARLRGDVDLIGWDAGKLCFIEVKTRTARDLTPAETQVDDDKRRILRSLARAYLRSFPADARTSIPVRFDVVSVYLVGNTPQFDHFPGAFGWR